MLNTFNYILKLKIFEQELYERGEELGLICVNYGNTWIAGINDFHLDILNPDLILF